jgi:preprotein translocase subunit SecB
MTEATQTAADKQFQLQKIYIKDVSFETPNSPDVFMKEWTPEVELNLGSAATQIQDNTFEVTLKLTVTVRLEQKTAYLIEISQAAIVAAVGFEENELSHLLGSYCPNILFPYAREAVSDLVIKGGFPPMLLAPVNFDALYAQRLEEMSAAHPTSH